MILDTYGTFCNGTALNTGGAGNYIVGDVIDLQALRDIGQSADLDLMVQIATTVASAGAATVQFSLVSDSTPTIATDGTATVHVASGAIGKATLVAGYAAMTLDLPLEDPAYERYLGIMQTTGTAALTAGAVNAFLVDEPAKWKAYADGQN